MRKKPLFISALLGLALWAAPALAETFTQGSISFELPDKWRAEFDPAQGLFKMYPPVAGYAIALAVNDSEGLGVEELAAKIAKGMNGSKPKPVENSPDYFFDAIQDGEEISVTVTVVGPKGLAMMERGDYEPHGLLPYQIIQGTLRSTDPAEQALFDTLPRLFKGNTVVFELPKGWQAKLDPADNSIQAHNQASDCVVTLAFIDTGKPVSPQEMAAEIAKSMSGAEPKPINKKNRGFTFRIIDDGVENNVTVVGVGQKVLVLTESGEIDDNSEPLSTIWSTLVSTDPAEQAVIDEYFSDDK
jgi:hypothetical protein